MTELIDGHDSGSDISEEELLRHLTRSSNQLLTPRRVELWVRHGLGFPQYAEAFGENAITALDFPELIANDGAVLREDLGVKSTFHLGKITRALKRQILGLGSPPPNPSTSAPSPSTTPPSPCSGDPPRNPACPRCTPTSSNPEPAITRNGRRWVAPRLKTAPTSSRSRRSPRTPRSERTPPTNSASPRGARTAPASTPRNRRPSRWIAPARGSRIDAAGRRVGRLGSGERIRPREAGNCIARWRPRSSSPDSSPGFCSAPRPSSEGGDGARVGVARRRVGAPHARARGGGERSVEPTPGPGPGGEAGPRALSFVGAKIRRAWRTRR